MQRVLIRNDDVITIRYTKISTIVLNSNETRIFVQHFFFINSEEKMYLHVWQNASHFTKLHLHTKYNFLQWLSEIKIQTCSFVTFNVDII